MKKLLTLFAFLLCFASNAKGQTNIQSGPTNPANCNPTVGQLFFNNSTSPGIMYTCSALNTWTPAGGGSTQVNVPCASSLTFTTGGGFITDFFLTLNCNVTSSVMGGIFTTGAEAVFTITQGTGGNTFAWPVNFLNTPTLATGPGATTVATFQYCGALGNGASCPANDWQNTDVGPATANPDSVGTTIDMKRYGVVADLRTCVGTQGGLTNGQPTFTCTAGNFCNGSTVACPAGQTSDVGKRINGTSGCCNISPLGAPANTQIIPNNCTILSVQSTTSLTMNCNATATQSSSNNLFVWWATDDDAAVAAADTAYQTAPTCTTLLWPATPFLVKNPHFNVANPQCIYGAGGGVGGLRAPSGSYLGWGPNSSVMYLDSTFPNSTSCTFGQNSNGCFFSYAGVHAEHLAIAGGWNTVPNGGGHSYSLLNPGINAYFFDDSFTGFAGGDGTSIGLYAVGFSNFNSVFLEQFGKNCMTNNGSNNVFSQGYYGNCFGPSAQFSGSSGVNPVTTNGISFGTAPNTINEVIITGGPWWSYGDYIYGGGSTCVSNQGSAGSNVYFDGATLGGNGTCPTSYASVSGTLATFHNSQFTSTTTAIQLFSGANATDEGGNTFTGAGTFAINATAKYFTNPTSTYANQTGLVPTCTFTSGGGTSPSCALQAGSTNEKGVIIATTGTGAPGSAGTVTLTFAGTYSGPTGTAPACVYNVDNSGTAWGNEAGTQVSTQSTTAPIVAWFNVNSVVATALTVSSPYRIDYTCTQR